MKGAFVISLLVVIASFYFVKKRYHNNVCKTFEDYYTDRDNNKNCYYNPEIYMKVDEIIKRRGYPLKTYNATTQDGYILTVFRIQHGKTYLNSTNLKTKQPVLLMHGCILNSESFVNTGHKSLAFILADAGYDVWLGNFRGSAYSQNHLKLSNTDRAFWNFSVDENGLYDVPATVDLVTSTTEKKLIYIGYSMGGSAGFIYGTIYPQTAADKVKAFISLSPAAFLSESKSIIRHTFLVLPSLMPIVDWFSNGRVYLRFPPRSLREYLCLPFPFQMKACHFMDSLAWGTDSDQIDPETLPVTLIQNNDLVSTKLLDYVFQNYANGGKFEAYNYGSSNKLVYGTNEPQQYDFSKLKVPVYLVTSKKDALCSQENVEKIRDKLPPKFMPYDVYVVKDPGFNHADFISGRDVVSSLYNHMLEIMKKFE